MDLGIKDRVAMVAAASKGLGFAIAQAMAAEGCRLSICSRNEESLARACERLGSARGHVCDVTNAENLQRWYRATCDELGPPEIVITNTGGPPAGPLFEKSDAEWQAGFEGTILCAVRLAALAAPRMKELGWGRIVHLTSYVAKSPSLMLPISSTLRTGIVALTRIQALELAPYGITVNAVLPGHTLTDRQRELASLRAQSLGVDVDEALRRQAEDVPMKRLARPDEIASAVAFLCSERTSYVTGVSLLVDGGAAQGLG
jgi:3-oxoacyl-[acyl-carrier protein] reductase